MPSRVPPIARIRLARSTGRLLVLPVLLIMAGAGLAVAAWLGPMRAPDPPWIAMVGAGALIGVIGLVMAAWLLSIRLEVEEAAVRIRWLWGERVYGLVPGPVTRVRLRGANASALRARTGFLGWAVGRARLRGEETIEIVRLARTQTVILVPTERGRLAIAAASEPDLIDALSRAARARQRLEELARVAPRVEAAPEPEPAPESVPEPDLGPPAFDTTEPEPEPQYLTGIERAELEERLARQGREAAASAEAEQLAAAALPARIPIPEPAPAMAAPTAAEPARRRWSVRGHATARLGRPRPSAAFVLLPLVGAGAVWGVATAQGRLPDPATDIGRLTSLGLVLAGPATSVGAIMARAWWPRLVGVVVTSGLASAVFVGRAILGV
jgi:hypothetical protein